MEDKNTNTCIFKGIENIEYYVAYLLDKQKHQGQLIFHNNVIEKTQYLLDTAKSWKEKQVSKKGHKPKPLSLVLSFPPGINEKELLSNSLGKLHTWIKKISSMEGLNLNDNDIEKFVREIPYVGHYKKSNPHIHFLVPKIFPKKIVNSNGTVFDYIYINLYKFKYSNPLYQISGWSMKEKIENQIFKNSQSSEVYLKNKLYDEIENYKNLNSKLDKFITLIEKDLSRGHTKKALKKLEKIRTRNGK